MRPATAAPPPLSPFPAGVRVISFGEVAGWQLEEVRDSASAIVGAVWTGSLPPERFIEFPFVAVNPRSPATLAWPAFQTYADGERVDWVGPEGSDRPTSSTAIEAGDGSGGSWLSLYLSIAAALLALTSLGLVLRHRS